MATTATTPRLIPHDDLLGVPWVLGGRDPATGLDCWGVVVELRRRAGLATPDPFRDWDAADDRRAFSLAVVEAFGAAWQSFAPAAVVPVVGDVASLPSYRGHATHAAVCVGRDLDGRAWMVQATRGAGVAAVLWTRLLSHAAALYRGRD